MGQRGRKPTGKITKKRREDLQEFESNIYKSVEDLDWALRMYYLTLREFGVTDSEATNKMQEKFVEAMRLANITHGG